MNLLYSLRHLVLTASAVSIIHTLPSSVGASGSPCAAEMPCAQAVYVEERPTSWVFARSTYTHDPETGARVAQYMRTRPVEPLEDERLVTSRYRRSQTNLRGTDGSNDSYYEVQNWGNGRGGLDSEWERFHNAWKESYLTGSYFNSPGNNGWNNGGWGNGGWNHGGWNGGWGNNGGWNNGGWGNGGWNNGPFPGGGGWPQQGGPPPGGPPPFGPPQGGPPQNGPWNNNGPQANWQQGGNHHGGNGGQQNQHDHND